LAAKGGDLEVEEEITSNDKILGALCYLVWIVAVVVLLTDMKERPFLKYHAVQSLALTVIGLLCITLCITIPLEIWGIIAAATGQYVVFPVLTDFLKNQGWI